MAAKSKAVFEYIVAFCVRIPGNNLATLSENSILFALKSIGMSQRANPVGATLDRGERRICR